MTDAALGSATPSTAGSTSGADPQRTVTEFLAALRSLDPGTILSYAATDIVYHNVSLPPAEGKEAFAKQIHRMAKYLSGFDVRVVNSAVNGDTVLTERVDALQIGPWRGEFWVCGTFEVRDGTITVWRDYFDWATLLAASAKGGVRALAAGAGKVLRRG